MAAQADSIPFLSSHAFRSRRFQIIGPNGEVIEHPAAVFQVSTYNLQNKWFMRSFATGMRAEYYQNSRPEKGQILYTTAGQKITYKYQDASGQIQEKTAVKSAIGLLAARPTLADYEGVLLAQVQREHHSFQPISLSNNPFGVNESVEAYEARKKAQIEQIVSAIEAGDAIINLQEIDFLKNNGSQEPGLGDAKKRLQQYFFYCLDQKGYGWIINEDDVNQQPLAVIYNKEMLIPAYTAGVLSYNGTKGPHLFRGLEITFSLQDESGPLKTIVNTNLHLQYDHDYRSEIENEQGNYEHKQGVMHIMMGDCGNCRNLPTALTSEECTSLGKDLQRRNTVFQGLAFVVAPEGYSVRSIVNRERSDQFIQLGSGISCVQSNDTQFYCTRAGMRWYAEAQPIPTPGLSPSHSQSDEGSGLEDFEDLGVESNSLLHEQDDDFVEITKGNKPRGQVLFIRATQADARLNTEIYKNLLASPTGVYENFELIDAQGNMVRGGNKSIYNTAYVYPGNPTQVLINPTEANSDQWRFKQTTAPQSGHNLAVIANGVTSQKGHAFPLPTTFFRSPAFIGGLDAQSRQQALATLQMARFHDLLDAGLNVAVLVKPWDQSSAFQPDQFVAKKAEINYDLAFWGGVQQVNATASPLAAIYADGVKAAVAAAVPNSFPNEWQINYQSLWDYFIERSRQVDGVSFFGLGFSKGNKVGAVTKLIQAIIHYNTNGSMEGFRGERLTEQEFKALSDGGLEQAVQQALKQAGEIYPAILEAIKPQAGFSLTPTT